MKVLIQLIITLAMAFAVLAQENTTFLTLFENVPWNRKLDFLKAQDHKRSEDEFLDVLISLNDSGIETGSVDEQEAKKSLATWLCRNLTQKKVTKAFAVFHSLAQQYQDPYVCGEAWLASARLDDRTIIPDLVFKLHSVNISENKSRPEEILAYYLVLSCSILTAPETFPQMLKASFGWYSSQSRVKESAKKALPHLGASLTENLLALLKNDPDLDLRAQAWQMLSQNTDQTLVAKGATILLETLAPLKPQSDHDKEIIDQLRKSSLLALQNFPFLEALPILQTIFEEEDGLEILRPCSRALGGMADAKATTILADRLKKYNQRQKNDNNTAYDLLIVQELIAAIQASGQLVGQQALEDAEFSGYTPAIQRQASEALARLGRS